MKRITTEAVLMAAVFSFVALVPGSTGDAQDADVSPPISECAINTHGVQVQMVIDISSSLVKFDPGNLRGVLVEQWVRDLTALSLQGFDVRLAIAGYGTQWNPMLDWTVLDGTSVSTALDVISRLTKGDADTDHALALLRASESLDAESARIEDSGGVPCPMLLWFTDGGYDFGEESAAYRRDNGYSLTTPYSDLAVNSDNEDQIKAAGEALMCGPGGPVISMRTQKTDIVAVALNPELDFRLVEELSSGNGWPDGDTGPGCRLPFYKGGTFEAVTGDTSTTSTTPSTSTAPETTIPPPACDAQVGCIQIVELDVPSLTDVMELQVDLADPSDELRSIALRTPGGTVISATGLSREGATLESGGYQADVVVLDPTSAIVSVPQTSGADLAGQWQIEIGVASEMGTVSVSPTFRSFLTARLVEGSSAEYGLPAEVGVALVDGDGQTIDSRLIEQLTLTATALSTDAPVAIESRPDGTFVLQIPPELSTIDSDTLDIGFSLNADPVRFEQAQLSVPIIRPEFPTIRFPEARDGVIRPPVIDTPGRIEVLYVVSGARLGEGCVVGVTSMLGSSDGLTAGVTYGDDPQTCVQVGTETSRTLLIEFDRRVAGRACGSLGFELSGATTEQTRQFSQAICVRTERGSTWWTRLIAGLLALLGLLPMVVLGFLNRWSGRLPSPEEITIATARVAIGDGKISTLGGVPLLDRSSFKRISEVGGLEPHSLTLRRGAIAVQSRAITVPRATGRSALSINMLFSGPRMYLMPMETPVIVGSAGHQIHVGPLDEPVRLPRNLNNLWILELSPFGAAGVHADITVIRLFGQGPSVNELSDSIRATVDRLANQLLATESATAKSVGIEI